MKHFSNFIPLHLVSHTFKAVLTQNFGYFLPVLKNSNSGLDSFSIQIKKKLFQFFWGSCGPNLKYFRDHKSSISLKSRITFFRAGVPKFLTRWVNFENSKIFGGPEKCVYYV